MLEKGTIVFFNWTVEEAIGSGAFGTVYKIKRVDFGQEYFAAMKVIHIPQDESDKKRLYSEGMSDEDISVYYKQIAGDFIKEIKLLSSLDGVTNIVDYKDHIIEPNEDLGYTIYIKMQLLTPLSKLLVGEGNVAKFLKNEDAVKLGKDICSALELCESKRVIHRDIKIDNIFVSDSGDYKLGDFGIARQLEATQGEMSKKGTLMYMAPEVFKGEKYDRTADIYSLGIVLYRLLNKNRAPFFPDFPNPIKLSDKEDANAKRLRGDELPDIEGISPELNAVLKKACAYNPCDRYQSATEFKTALEGLDVTLIAPVVTPPMVNEETTSDEKTVGVFGSSPTMGAFSNPIRSDSFYEKETVTLVDSNEKTQSVFSVFTEDNKEENKDYKEPEIERKNKKVAIIVVIILIILALSAGIFFSIRHFSGLGENDVTKTSEAEALSSENESVNGNPNSTETTGFFVYLDCGNGDQRKKFLMEKPGLVGMPPNPTREGYVFAGWYSDLGLTDAWDFTTDIASGEMVIYAKWVAEDDENIDDILSNSSDVTGSYNDWFDEDDDLPFPITTEAPIKSQETTENTAPMWSEWSEWSEWTTTPATKTDCCDVKTRTVYSYDAYSFKCMYCTSSYYSKLDIGVISHTYQLHVKGDGNVSEEALNNLYELFRNRVPENKTAQQVAREAGYYTQTIYGIDSELLVSGDSFPYSVEYEGSKWYVASPEPSKIETQYSIRTRQRLE